MLKTIGRHLGYLAKGLSWILLLSATLIILVASIVTFMMTFKDSPLIITGTILLILAYFGGRP